MQESWLILVKCLFKCEPFNPFCVEPDFVVIGREKIKRSTLRSTKLMLGSKFYLCKVNLYANAPEDEMKLDLRMGKHLCRKSPQLPK